MHWNVEPAARNMWSSCQVVSHGSLLSRQVSLYIQNFLENLKCTVKLKHVKWNQVFTLTNIFYIFSALNIEVLKKPPPVNMDGSFQGGFILVWWLSANVLHSWHVSLAKVCSRPQYGKWVSCVAMDKTDDWLVRLLYSTLTPCNKDHPIWQEIVATWDSWPSVRIRTKHICIAYTVVWRKCSLISQQVLK